MTNFITRTVAPVAPPNYHAIVISNRGIHAHLQRERDPRKKKLLKLILKSNQLIIKQL